MKRFLSILALGLNAISLSSCDDNSQVDGYESYRYELWKLLIQHDYRFELVGTQVDSGDYPEFQGNVFDPYHEGIPGIETEGVLTNLNQVLASIDTPNVVLLGIGINDLTASNKEPELPIANMHLIIDRIQLHNPDAFIVVEQVPGGRDDFITEDMQGRIVDFNTQVAILAADQSDSTSTVVAVDMYSDFTQGMFIDPVHYNELGAKFLAQQYFNKIQNRFSNAENLRILTLGDSRVAGNRNVV